jgi:hypothetical protein
MTKEEKKEKRKVYNRKHYEDNKEKKLDRQKAYNEANKDKINARYKVYYQNNKDKINAKNKAYNEANKDKMKEYYKSYASKYYEDNKDKINETRKIYRKVNADKINERFRAYRKNRKEAEPLWKFELGIRSNIGSSFKRKGFKKKSKTFDILGCDYNSFVKHISDKFTDGMTLENQGEWHLDHQIPLALAETEEEVLELCHYTNYQPLWAKDNLEKHTQVRLENISFTNKLRYIKFLNRL